MAGNQSNTNLQKKASVLITGGSGLIGRYLTSTLIAEGYQISHLSRKTSYSDKVKVFRWDPDQNILDPYVFEGIDYIIHLAGANIGEKRWTERRKAEILNSRVGSVRLMHKVITDNGIRLKAFITASATGYYGSITSDKIFNEEDLPGNDFLATTCRKWEEAADLFGNDETRTVKIRSAVVLEKTDSALSKIMKPARFGFLVQTGNGRQYMPWIHIKDLCRIYLKAIEDGGMKGAFNAVSPQHVTNEFFMQTLAKVMKRPLFPIPVPAFILKGVLGEMSDVILKGSRASSEKIKDSGYNFLFGNLEEAFENVIYSQDVRVGQ
jgi:uncharacterized protein (TIGR01777 family)